MQTDIIDAWQVEEGDLITLGSDTAFEVKEKRDTGAGIDLNLCDEWDDCQVFSFTPDDPIQLVISLDDQGGAP